ncbi:MAG: efflux RND transporter permease subunit [Rhodospirillales bacterium]|nr:MAG: efflux RND transporter permease subunit [Rhodospirillales bacterium]
MIRLFAGHPTAANLLMIGILVLGLSALPSLERETFPDLPLGDVQVRVAYPGASAEEIEDALCRRIEDAVDGINDVGELRCEAQEGVATATIEMDEDGNVDRFLEDVKSEIEAIDDFPVRAERATIRLLGRNDFVAAVTIAGPMSEPDLKAYAEDMKERLQQIPEVTQVNITGFSDHQIRIEIPAQTLSQYGLSVSDIADVIGRQSIDLPAGSVETEERDVLIRFADERRTAADFGDLIVVGGESGAEIRLGEIAAISDRFELAEQSIFYDGRRAALLEINKARSGDTLVVVDAINAFLERERAVAPPTMSFSLTRDISTVVRDRLNMVLKNGAQGLALVLIALWLFFGLRFAFWVALGLPVSFLGTLFVMSLGGYSINMITMVGLLIATGLLMDDAIVISENIARHWRDGKAALEAAVSGVKEVGPGVLASYLTTICVFGPLTTLSGDIGNVLKFIPIILIMTLTVSMIEAFLILPSHLRHSLSHAGEVRGLRRRVESAIAWARERIAGRAADLAVEWRYAAIGSIVFLLLGSVAMIAGGVLKFQAFPKLDGDVVQARLLLPQGTPLARTEAVVDRLVETLEAVNRELSPLQPGGEQLVRQVGIEYGVNVDAFESGPHLATVTADLLAAESRNTSVAELIQAWRTAMGAVPDVVALKFAEFQIGLAGRPIDIRLKGSDLGALKAASRELQTWLSGYPAVSDLSDDLRPGKPEIRLRLREGALALGLDASQIASQLRSAYFGEVVSEVQAGPESYEIDVRLSALDRDSLADLDYFLVRAPGGAQVPLSTVAIIESGRGYARIHRINGRRTVSVQGDVDTTKMNVSQILSDTTARFLPQLRDRFPGIEFALEGEAKTGAEGTSSVGRAFAVGVIGIFLLLSFLFRSYAESLIVIVTIPLSLIGVVWGHLLMGLDLSMPSMVGFAALSGVVVNNAILLVDFTKRRAATGMSIEAAARAAARIRFRPVLLTSLTTVLGLLPMLLERSLQAQILVPLVTSLAFGLFAATVLVLFTVPALYAILHDFGLTAVARERDTALAG